METVLWLSGALAELAAEGLPGANALFVLRPAWLSSCFLTLSEPSFLGHAALHLAPLIILAGTLAGVGLVRHAMALLSTRTVPTPELAGRRVRPK